MLGAHSLIATSAEPWLLLPLLYSLREGGVYAEYGHRMAANAISDFSERLPEGEQGLRSQIVRAALSIYSQASGSRPFFLDKTPRYMLIVEELLALFGDAKFIALWRNPLSILSSLSLSWAGGRWQPYHHKIDLFTGLENLVDAVSTHPQRFIEVRYEDLVCDPQGTCRSLLAALALPWEEQVLSQFTTVDVSGRFGDKTGTNVYSSVSTDPLSKWQPTLVSPVRRAWARRYLNWVGHERLDAMGYDLDDLLAQLGSINADWSLAVPDSLESMKGVAYNLLEPMMMRAKLRRISDWKRAHNHT